MTHFSFPRSAALKQAIALAACAACLGSCASQEKKAQDPQSENPRIVSLNPCVDAILVEVAPADQILALSHYSRDPSATTIGTARASAFGVTGGTVEEVAALSPDLVIGGSFVAPATR
ncbi:MAG: ABC transporter substrate-binding protein, partial [Marinomonas sp.]